MLTFTAGPLARLLLAATLALSLAAGCGGVDSGGTGVAAFAVGPINGYGSIIVNGTRFDDTTALIQDDDGTTLTRDQLKLGMMSTVDATGLVVIGGSPRATAASIRIGSELLGPVDVTDAATGTLSVLGQTVLVTAATVFDERIPGGMQGLSAGGIVEVYGRYDPSRSRYAATRIEPRSAAAYYKLRGAISQVDANRQAAVIGGQTIDCSGLPASEQAMLSFGAIVRVRLHKQGGTGVWVAAELASAVARLPDRVDAQVEGRITAWQSSTDFSVDGVPVDAGAASFPDGASGVALGARVEVEGASVGGVLRARVVKVEGDEDQNNSEFELHGAIETLDTATKTFVLRGVTVDYSGDVTFENGSAGTLAPGRQVQVQGVVSVDGIRIRAQSIQFEEG